MVQTLYYCAKESKLLAIVAADLLQVNLNCSQLRSVGFQSKGEIVPLTDISLSQEALFLTASSSWQRQEGN